MKKKKKKDNLFWSSERKYMTRKKLNVTQNQDKEIELYKSAIRWLEVMSPFFPTLAVTSL